MWASCLVVFCSRSLQWQAMAESLAQPGSKKMVYLKVAAQKLSNVDRKDLPMPVAVTRVRLWRP